MFVQGLPGKGESKGEGETFLLFRRILTQMNRSNAAITRIAMPPNTPPTIGPTFTREEEETAEVEDDTADELEELG